VEVDTGRRRFTTVALIDPFTPVSCIDASLARAFGLRSTTVDGGKVALRIRTLTRALGDEVRARFDSIQLADNRFHRPATVFLVLGADLYPQPGFLNLGSGLPIAQSTVFTLSAPNG
ncbi:hypothetical protein KR018_003010, partial [Drosophila ironensis]